MERKFAFRLLEENLKDKNLRKHSLAVETAMKHFADHFGKDAKKWALAGLLHDLDYEETKNEPSKHGYITTEKLEKYDLPEEVIYAIKAHPGHVERISLMDKVLYSVDSLTGLIVAATLMHPKRKISALDTGFVMRRFKEKRFASGANRDQIKACSEFDMSLEDFIEHTVRAMASIEDDLGF